MNPSNEERSYIDKMRELIAALDAEERLHLSIQLCEEGNLVAMINERADALGMGTFPDNKVTGTLSLSPYGRDKLSADGVPFEWGTFPLLGKHVIPMVCDTAQKEPWTMTLTLQGDDDADTESDDDESE